MRRSIALLAGVAAVFVVAARPVAAAPNAPSNATAASVPADAVGLSLAQVEGAGLAVTLDPGASEEHDLVVSNHTANLRLTIKLSATDATGSLGTGPASWLAFGDDEIELDPHVATTVPMTVAVPHDTQPGSALAHVSVSVESAVSAADGTPVAGTASASFPVSITVTGTPTAQIAIADVHRDDQGPRHQLAIVLRNFGSQGAPVSGHVRVAGDSPQTIPFHADLAGSADTTVELNWHAPPVGTASDISVDLEYGGGNVASWSSELGGAPTDLTPTSAPATSSTAATPTVSVASGGSSASKPWWKQTFVLVLVILVLLAAGSWFGFEMLATRRRRDNPMAEPGMAHPGWAPGPSGDSIDLAKQLVRLTEIVVELVAAHRDEQEFSDDRARARSPGFDPADAAAEPRARSRLERDELGFARAGPAPPEAVGAAEHQVETPTEVTYPASMTVGAVARPEPDASEMHGVAAARAVAPAADESFDDSPGHVRALVAPTPDESFDESLRHAPGVDAPVVDAPVVNGPVADAPAGAEPLPVAPIAAAPIEEPVVEEPPVVQTAAEAPVVEVSVVEAPVVEEPVAAEIDDATAPLMARLVELDRERRRLRDWMDAEDSGQAIEPSADWFSYSGESDGEDYRADAPDGSS